jgi:hypothetical protein
MPTKEYRDKQRVKALTEMDPKIKLLLKPSGVAYIVFASQLAVLSYFAVSTRQSKLSYILMLSRPTLRL